jgi:hypothetical protein
LLLGLTGTSCLLATVAPNPLQFSVVFDGLGLGLLPANCVLGASEVTMTLTAQGTAAPGNYTVTITEVRLGGSLISQRTWPFTVVTPTTSTSLTTTTSTVGQTTPTSGGALTTTTSPGATTTQPTGTGQPTGPTTPPTGGTSPPSGAGGSQPDGNQASGDESENQTSGDEIRAEDSAAAVGDGAASSTPDAMEDPSDDAGQQTSAAGRVGGPGDGPPAPRISLGESDGYGAIALSESLRDELGGAMPDVLADAAFSPLVIGEILLRSLFETAAGVPLPVLLTTPLAAGGLWRLRKGVSRDELDLVRSVGV